MADQNYPETLNALITLGVLTDADAATAYEVAVSQGVNVLQMLHESGRITGTDVVRANCVVANIEFVELLDYNIDVATLGLIPGETARRHNLVPLTDIDGVLTVAVAHKQVGDLILRDDLVRLTRRRVVFAVAMKDDITAKINRVYRADAELNELASDVNYTAAGVRPGSRTDLSAVVEADAGEGPVVKFVNRLIEQAIDDGASDIHIDPTDNGLTVRFRVDGVLKVSSTQPKSMVSPLISRLKIMSNMDIAEKRVSQGGRISFGYKGKRVDLRAVAIPTIHGHEKVVLRVLDNAAAGLSLHGQGFSDDNLARFQAAYRQPSGLVLITGGTGTGKSSSLSAAIQEIASPRVNVITIEDPVEYVVPGITQIQVNEKTGFTFSAILEDVLRADPEVIMVGEIRDEETARLAIRGALTGHLVLSTLHTNDAASSITRLIDMGIEPFLVASALKAAVAQRLVRRLCIKCREQYTLTPEDLAGMPDYPWHHGEALPTVYKAHEGGCNSCSNTGYKGRVAIHEVMTVNRDITRLAVAQAPAEDIDAKARELGMTSLQRDGWAKVASGITSVEEIARVVV